MLKRAIVKKALQNYYHNLTDHIQMKHYLFSLHVLTKKNCLKISNTQVFWKCYVITRLQ